MFLKLGNGAIRMAGTQSNARGFDVRVLNLSVCCLHKITKQHNSSENNSTTNNKTLLHFYHRVSYWGGVLWPLLLPLTAHCFYNVCLNHVLCGQWQAPWHAEDGVLFIRCPRQAS